MTTPYEEVTDANQAFEDLMAKHGGASGTEGGSAKPPPSGLSDDEKARL